VVSEPALWTRLDLSPSSGVTVAVTDAVLRGAAARARGGLVALHVSTGRNVSQEALVAALRANASTLTELRIFSLTLYFLDPLFDGGEEALEALLRAAPRLTRCETDVHCDPATAVRMLRNEPPFGALRVRQATIHAGDALQPDAALAVAAAVSTHASLTSLRLRRMSLAAPAALDAVVDATIARRLHTLVLDTGSLSPASAPALARLLRCGALRELSLLGVAGPQLLDAPAAALLAAALRDNSSLTSLSLAAVALWADAAAAAALLGALTAHPRLRTLACHDHAEEHGAAAAGAAFGALLAANAPALTELDVNACGLRDAGMAPLADALAGNTHLRVLWQRRERRVSAPTAAAGGARQRRPARPACRRTQHGCVARDRGAGRRADGVGSGGRAGAIAFCGAKARCGGLVRAGLAMPTPWCAVLQPVAREHADGCSSGLCHPAQRVRALRAAACKASALLAVQSSRLSISCLPHVHLGAPEGQRRAHACADSALSTAEGRTKIGAAVVVMAFGAACVAALSHTPTRPGPVWRVCARQLPSPARSRTQRPRQCA
jgi:hypothetical protein